MTLVKLTFKWWRCAAQQDWFESWGCCVLPGRIVIAPADSPVLKTWTASQAAEREEITVDVIPEEWVRRGLRVNKTGPQDLIVVNA